MSINNNNNRLSFDVLSGIFEIIATMETIKDPLEKLLLICRCWNIAARSHCSIWKRIKVKIGHEHTFPSCISHVTRRLALSGSSTPLDIEVCVAPTNSSRSPGAKAFRKVCSGENGCCDTASVSLAEHILEILAGSHGEGSKRWRSLYLSISIYGFGSGAYLFDTLKHPMPLLQTLRLHHLVFDGEAFPSCPALVDVDFEKVYIKSLPEFQNLRKFYLMVENSRPVNILGLDGAIQLEYLELFLSKPGRVTLPPCLPSVHHFSMGGIAFPEDFALQLPNVKKLTVEYDRSDDLQRFIASSGIPFSRIESLEINWYDPHLDDHVELQGVLWTLNLRCSKAQVVKMDILSFFMLLKSMWQRRRQAGEEQSEASVSPWGNRVVQVQTEKYEATSSESKWSVRQPVLVSISGTEDIETLARYASEAGAPELESNWRYIRD